MIRRLAFATALVTVTASPTMAESFEDRAVDMTVFIDICDIPLNDAAKMQVYRMADYEMPGLFSQNVALIRQEAIQREGIIAQARAKSSYCNLVYGEFAELIN